MKKSIKGLIVAGIIAGVGAATATYLKKKKEFEEQKVNPNVNGTENNKEEMEDLFSRIRKERGWNTEESSNFNKEVNEEHHCNGTCNNCTCNHTDEEESYSEEDYEHPQDDEEEESYSEEDYEENYDEENNEENYDEEDNEENYDEEDNIDKLKRLVMKALNNSADIDDIRYYLIELDNFIESLEISEDDSEYYLILNIIEKTKNLINDMDTFNLKTLEDLKDNLENNEEVSKMLEKATSLMYLAENL